MRGVLLGIVLAGLTTLAGCTRTCEVRFTNLSGSTTDFRIDEYGTDLDTLVLDLAPGSNPVTVIHHSMGNRLTIQSGSAIGQTLTIVDATCQARITDGDTVEVTKGPDGQLDCVVIPGLPDNTSKR
ncbi:hypothetical protein GC163_17750 [bacterium]|nr:hypothetical protein [bacterium]